MESISEKVKTRLQANQGISSDDIADLVTPDESEDAKPAAAKSGNTMHETSDVEPEKPEKHDSVISTSVAELDNKNFFLGLLGAVDSQKNIKITPEDKSGFVDAVLTGSRMKMPFSFFGGKLAFTIKNRTYEEARAAMTMAARKGAGLGELNTVFTMRLRSMLMCMQIDEFNGEKFEDAETLGPLMPVYKDGETKDPAWMERLNFFGRLPEAVFEAVWQCIYEFEQKYWTLVRHSRDQDFWRPE